jgi:alpha-tubulin suppressor-like RCC1 family protein
MLTEDGAAYCWGLNNARQLGYESSSSCRMEKASMPCSPLPLPVQTELRFTNLTAGEAHTCGLTMEGQAYCWGGNARGQLGSDSALANCSTPGDKIAVPCTAHPVPVAGGLSFTALAAGAKHTCGMTVDGTVYCWGSNAKGQLGAPAGSKCRKEACSLAALRVDAGPFAAVAAGGDQTCGIRPKGEVLCWGTWGRWTKTPEQVPSFERFGLVAVGRDLIVGLTIPDEVAYHWGTLRTPDGTATRDSPKAVRGFLGLSASGYTMVAVGAFHVCALDAKGVVYCWGDHGTGQLGIGRESVGGFLGNALKESISGVDDAGTDRPGNWKELPQRIKTTIGFSRIAAGYLHTCGLGQDGQIRCWGSNAVGQLGSPNLKPAYQPQEVQLGSSGP